VRRRNSLALHEAHRGRAGVLPQGCTRGSSRSRHRARRSLLRQRVPRLRYPRVASRVEAGQKFESLRRPRRRSRRRDCPGAWGSRLVPERARCGNTREVPRTSAITALTFRDRRARRRSPADTVAVPALHDPVHGRRPACTTAVLVDPNVPPLARRPSGVARVAAWVLERFRTRSSPSVRRRGLYTSRLTGSFVLERRGRRVARGVLGATVQVRARASCDASPISPSRTRRSRDRNSASE